MSFKVKNFHFPGELKIINHRWMREQVFIQWKAAEMKREIVKIFQQKLF